MRNRLLLLLLMLSFLPVFAQEQVRRPKVGLALSGGAAKGLAHIGVLKVLEEVGLRPDLITGTSMGSIVGGLYAMGYPADSLLKIASGLNWSSVLSDNIILRQVVFEEKPYFRNELIELPIREGKLRQPQGLIQGQQIEELLNRLTLPACSIDDFDQLPIPFRCLAADVVTGQPVEISSGSLAQALRASMAIPTIFSPVLRDTMVLVDGGLIRNFPVQELKQMGADIIIGVYVGAEPQRKELPTSITEVLYQIAFMQSVEDYRLQLPLMDVYIEPELFSYSATSFASVDSIIAIGERAARLHLDEFRRLADSLNAIAPPYPVRSLPGVETICFDRFEVPGKETDDALAIIGQSGLNSGEDISPKLLKSAIETIYGSNRFSKVSYELMPAADETVLRFLTVDKASNLLKASLIYDSYHEAGLAFNLILRDVMMPASRLMLVGRLANNHRYRVEYLKYIDKRQRRFLQFSIQFNRDQVPSVEDGRIVEQFRLFDSPIDLGFHRRVGRNWLLGAGGQLELLTLRPEVSQEPPFNRLSYQNMNLWFVLEHNSLDRNVLPRRGNRLFAEAKWVSSLGYQVGGLNAAFSNPDSLFRFDPYLKLTFRSESYLPLSHNESFLFSPFAGLIGSDDVPINDVYLLGAPTQLSRRSLPFYGLEANELVVQTALGLHLGYQRFLRDNLMIGAQISSGFFGQPEFGSAGVTVPDRFVAGIGLSLGFNSLLGPFQLNAMHPLVSEGNLRERLKFFFSFGHRF